MSHWLYAPFCPSLCRPYTRTRIQVSSCPLPQPAPAAVVLRNSPFSSLSSALTSPPSLLTSAPAFSSPSHPRLCFVHTYDCLPTICASYAPVMFPYTLTTLATLAHALTGECACYAVRLLRYECGRRAGTSLQCSSARMRRLRPSTSRRNGRTHRAGHSPCEADIHRAARRSTVRPLFFALCYFDPLADEPGG